jgi:hypothetical protein
MVAVISTFTSRYAASEASAPKYEKMRFKSAPRQKNKQRRRQHLPDGDDMPGVGAAWMIEGEGQRQQVNQPGQTRPPSG